MSDLLERVNFDLIEAAFLGPGAHCQHNHGLHLRCPDPCLGEASHRVIVGCGTIPSALWCLAVVEWHAEHRQKGLCGGCGRRSHDCWTVLPV